MQIPDGVGPHEGRELELMLSGRKPCAIFTDAIPDSDTIAEEIIPEAAFAPYVLRKEISRFSQDFKYMNTSTIIRCVCFTLPNETWRAQFLMWLKNRLFNLRLSDDSDDILEGRILGYEEKDIATYILHKNNRKKSP